MCNIKCLARHLTLLFPSALQSVLTSIVTTNNPFPITHGHLTHYHIKIFISAALMFSKMYTL